MKTITLQIGNSDNKLTQREWAAFCNAIHRCVIFYTSDIQDSIHFSAPSVGWADWQNAAWIFSVSEDRMEKLKDAISSIRKDYRQDSAAWTEGRTAFI